MKNSVRQFIYVSGPPCAGKSSLCRKLIKINDHLRFIEGDKYWINNDQNDFNTRVDKTNRDILSSLKCCSSKSILLEWVPSCGQFVEG